MNKSKYREGFYRTPIWRRCREAFLKKKRYICERCGGTAKIVHHKIYLTDENILDTDISLGEDNLEALCIECHNKEHDVKNKMSMGYKTYRNKIMKQKQRRFVWTDDGRCTPL